jgi:hypothetical protein
MRMSELLNEVRRFELDEGFSPREIKMAIGIASDPRYAKGNMTGAVNAIEKMKKGLSDHPQVAAVLKRQNEDLDEAMKGFKVEFGKGNDAGMAVYKDKKDAEAFAKRQPKPIKITQIDVKNANMFDDPNPTRKEAVSPAQQAAIAISKKEKGEKPKDEKDEGNTFGKELKAARDKGEKTFVVSGKKYNVTEADDFKPHMMYDPKTGKGYEAKTMDDHLRMKKMGYDHEKPEVKEKVEPSRIVEPYRPEFGLDEISTFSRAHIAILKKTFDPMRDKKLGPKGQAKLSKIMDMIGDKKDALIDLFKADIPFVSQSAAAMLITKYNMKGDEINKLKEEVDLDEKYDLYHKDFSSAMQHAYDYAKSKMGITVDPKEIDSKVATGPKKPTEGKTNKYMLKGKGGNLQIQVYNKGGSKPFELNMYKEENNLIAAAVGHLSND